MIALVNVLKRWSAVFGREDSTRHRPLGQAGCILALATCVTACDGSVHVTGRILAEDGGAATAYPVVLRVFGGELESERRVEGTSDGEGRYDLEVGVGGAEPSNSRMMLEILDPAGAARANVIAPAERELDVPDLNIWRDAQVQRLPDGGARVDWSSIPPGTGPRPVVLVNTADGSVLWSQVAEGAHCDLRPELTEDLDTKVSVTFFSTTEGYGKFGVMLTSPPIALARGYLLPLTRGAPCTYMAETEAEPFDGPCPITDGRFTRIEFPMQRPAGWTIDLGDAKVIHEVIVRASVVFFGTPLVIEGSSDGTAFREFASDASCDAPCSIAVDAAQTIRYLRIRSENGSALESITEISAF
jgi:hypothetical protein